MSAAIHARVLERRAAVARAQAEAAERDAFIAAARGAKGDQGDAGPMPAHEWKGSKLRFEQPDGKWGRFVDLKGKPGKDGEAGAVIVRGGNSAGGTDLDSLPVGSSATPTEIAVKQGGAWVRLSWAQFIAMLPAGAPSNAVTLNGDPITVNGSFVVSGSEQGADEMAVYSKRTDFISDSLFYRGEALPGTAESAAFWRIARVTIGADGDVTEEWAAGSAAFDKVWDDRASLIYS